MRLINTQFDTYKNHLILNNIDIQNTANGIYPDHIWTVTTRWLMARDKLSVTLLFKGGSESGFTAIMSSFYQNFPSPVSLSLPKRLTKKKHSY